MKVVFMGTPDFAAEILKAVKEAGHEVVLAVTQEDKPGKRGKELIEPAVKQYAKEQGIEVYQPQSLKRSEAVSRLLCYAADIFVVAAYGKLLPGEILRLPKYGCVNVHASLLPKYRGAAPIQRAILSGEKITGVTIMQMNEGLDTGDILLQRELAIAPDETGESLFERLSSLGAKLIVEALEQIQGGGLTPIKQDETFATYAPKLVKEEGELDFTKTAEVLERSIRGLYSWPGAYTYYRDKLLKVFRAGLLPEEGKETEPGRIVSLDGGIVTGTGDGLLRITELQLAGKKRMSAQEFLRGFPMKTGEYLGRRMS
ncbi:MAG: methionyl-tRNA formyltransferase [Lachnospiraceae bacterium]|nr:methionyl-tRNA formyltransferase [Lachnospiraceae bacterium]